MTQLYSRSRTSSGVVRDQEDAPLPVAMREMDLTVEEALELRDWLENPTAQPTRPPFSLPAGDVSMIR